MIMIDYVDYVNCYIAYMQQQYTEVYITCKTDLTNQAASFQTSK